MSDIKKKVEAVLFSAGKRLSVDELAKLCRAKPIEVLNSLEQLKKEYDEKQSSLVIVNEENHWKFSVREQFVSVVRKVVAETELTKSVLETLAVIAYRYPILQSDLIKIRTNKAYDHLMELEKSGYISRKKKGRTNLLMLTDRFFGYFDLAPDKLKEKFRDFDSIARAIEERETESKRIKSDQKKYAEEAKQQDDRIKKEIDDLDASGEEYKVPLEVYEGKKQGISVQSEFEEKGSLMEEHQKLGELEVVGEDKPKAGRQKKEKAEAEPEPEGIKEKAPEQEKTESKKDYDEETSDEDEAIQKAIENLTHPKKEEE